MSVTANIQPDAVYTGQQMIDFIKEVEAQYADKIAMIEAQRNSAQNDTIGLNIELGRQLRIIGVHKTEIDQLKGQVSALQQEIAAKEPVEVEDEPDETGDLFAHRDFGSDGVSGD